MITYTKTFQRPSLLFLRPEAERLAFLARLTRRRGSYEAAVPIWDELTGNLRTSFPGITPEQRHRIGLEAARSTAREGDQEYRNFVLSDEGLYISVSLTHSGVCKDQARLYGSINASSPVLEQVCALFEATLVYGARSSSFEQPEAEIYFKSKILPPSL